MVNLAYEARKLIAGLHDRLIGEAAARRVPDHSSVFLTIGTTTERWPGRQRAPQRRRHRGGAVGGADRPVPRRPDGDVLVADSSKFARSAPVRVAHLDDVDLLVTDRLPAAAAELCHAHGVDVVEAGGPVEAEEA